MSNTPSLIAIFWKPLINKLCNFGEDVTSVFKYRSDKTFFRDLDGLINNYFWAATRDKLNDPFEGMYEGDRLDFEINTINLLVKQATKGKVGFDEVKKSIEDLLLFVDKSGIFSLSTSAFEELLWAHYANSHNGYCVKYNLEKLIHFENKRREKIAVRYENKPHSYTLADFLGAKDVSLVLKKLLGIKSKSWTYESEVRLICDPSGKHEYDYRALEAIYFGLGSKKSIRRKVMKTLAGRGIQYFEIKLVNNAYKLIAEPIADIFLSSPKYNYHISEIEDGAINLSFLKPEQLKFSAYITKAAEIVRRDPYCEKVTYADFSLYRGTAESPVIYVIYENKQNQPINKFLTVSQIDNDYALISDLS